ncbi:MAG: NVEALA domain-containing protein [Prevotellaceae bacterium]|nr:NVEALA domain-containing protein [Prevotellaceae bacterium]
MKKILLCSAVVLCAFAIGFGIFANKSVTKESDLLAQNIEALAALKGETGENGEGLFHAWLLWNSGLNCYMDGVSYTWYKCTYVFAFLAPDECNEGGGRCGFWF